jgi:hypothetical protein
MAIRLSEPGGLVEVWVNADAPQTFTLGGSPSTATFTASTASIVVGQFAPASFAHLQFYLGPTATTYTRAQHLAQYQMAQTCLEYQTTGQRVNSILDYAGVPPGMRVVDTGQSFMSKALLSGQTAGQALQTAIDTERARAFMSGDGHYVFQDRQHTLNV